MGNGSDVRCGPCAAISMKPSSMSMFGVPYSPIVPSLTMCASGARSRMANSTFSVPMTLLYWVNTACCRDTIE